MSSSTVLAVVVAHASRTRLRETLRSLGSQTYDDLRIIVAVIGSLSPPDDVGVSYDLLRISDDVAFPGAVARALGHVPASEAPYVLLVHDDVSLEPGVVSELVRTAVADPSVVAVGPKLVEWDDPDVLQEVGAAVDRFGIRRSPLDAGEIDAGQRDEETDVLFCSDACLLVRREAFDRVGGLDPRIWPFYEDVDLCWRLRSAGGRVVVAPQARVRHAADLSRGRRLRDAAELRSDAERGRLRFLLKHYAPLGLAVLLPQVALASLARVLAATARRELWRVRITVSAWWSVVRDVPAIARERRSRPPPVVSDRDLLQLSARGALGDVRGERAEVASRAAAGLWRLGARALDLVRRPSAWAVIASVVSVAVVLRGLLFGGTFVLGGLRPPPALGQALADFWGHLRPEGLDPFAPPSPGPLVLGFVRSLVRSASFAEKLVLFAAVWLAGWAAARLGRTIGLGPDARRWLGALGAANPATLTLLRDGEIGGLLAWTASLLWVSTLLSPPEHGGSWVGRVRRGVRSSAGFALVGALEPSALVWLAVLGVAVGAAVRADGRTEHRLRLAAWGFGGALVLLLPSSLEWFTLRSPLVGRPAWLVADDPSALGHASLGAGWPLVGWLVLAAAGTLVVRADAASALLVALAAGGAAAGAAGVMPPATMLAGAGAASFAALARSARIVLADLRAYELGRRHAAVLAGVGAAAALWLGGVVGTAATPARVRSLPAEGGGAVHGRVLWIEETSGGVRTWVTSSFDESMRAVVPASTGAERLVSRTLGRARAGATDRLGAVLALADVSRVVALDVPSTRGLDGQVDLTPTERQGTATLYDNDAWRGPALLLPAPPVGPLRPQVLASVSEAEGVRVRGWPGTSARIGPLASGGVLAVASGPRGGVGFGAGRAHVGATGAWMRLDAGAVVRLRGTRWWRPFVPLELGLVLLALLTWLLAAYTSPPEPAPPVESIGDGTGRAILVAACALVVPALAFGYAWSASRAPPPFLSSSWLCPPPGEGFVERVAIVNPTSSPATLVLRTALTDPAPRRRRLAPFSRLTVSADPARGMFVETFGSPVAAAAQVGRGGRSDAAPCASRPLPESVFPEGGRSATLAVPRLFERYVIYNPYAEVARAAVRFLLPGEVIAPPPLQDVQVGPGGAVIVSPEDQFEPVPHLSTVVRVWQGRAVVARRLTTVDQVTWSLPALPLRHGVVPRAQTEVARTEVVVANPSATDAEVGLGGWGPGGPLLAQRFAVPSNRRAAFDVATVAPRQRRLVITLDSDHEVAVESLVAPDNRATVSLLPVQDPARRWVIVMGEGRTLVVSNPGPRRVRLRLRRLSGSRRGGTLRVGPHAVTEVPLAGEGDFGVLVEATGRVTVAAVGPAGSLAGLPAP